MPLKSFLLSLTLLLSPVAHAAIPPSGVVWAPQQVRYPVGLGSMLPAEPWFTTEVPETSGALSLSPGRGAAFYLDGLNIARVRVLDGSGVTPRVFRVVGGSRAAPSTGLSAALETSALPDGQGGWLLVEPAGDGDVWYVETPSAAKVSIERPDALEGQLIWEDVRAQLRAAITGDSPVPTLPAVAGAGQAQEELRAQEALGNAILAAGGPSLEPAVKAWRVAAALRAIDTIRPIQAPEWRITELDESFQGPAERLRRDDGPVATHTPWHRLAGPGASSFTLSPDGDGVVRLQVRALLPTGTLVASTPTVITVSRGGVVIDQRRFRGRPARISSEKDSAMPARDQLVTDDGLWAGRLDEIRVSVADGDAPIDVSVEGPALVRASFAERRAWLWEAITRDADAGAWVERGLAELQGDRSDAAALVRVLLLDVDRVSKEPVPLPAGLSPELALVGEVLTVQRLRVDDAGRDGFATRWRRALDAQPEKPWTWWLRLRMADVLDERQNASLFAAARVLPPDGLLLPLAEHLEVPPLNQDRPDRALGALELAWRGLPMDPGLRAVYLRRWLDGTTWSRMAPTVTLSGDAITPPPYTWLDTGAATGGPISAAAAVYYRVPAGTTRRFRADPNPVSKGSPKVLTTFVRTPKDGGLVGLTVDSRAFRMLPLSDVERADLAVPPGEHSVGLSGAPGSEVWVSLPLAEDVPVAPEDLATLRSYWPVSLGGQALRFEIPAPQISVPVRLELRALNPRADGRPVSAVVRTDTGASWSVTVSPGAADPSLVPIGDARPLSAVVAATVAVPQGTTEVWIESPDAESLVASMSVRRTRADEEAAAAAPESGANLSSLAALSARIKAAPDSPSLRLRRAEQLISLGDLEMARQDLRRLTRMGEAAIAALGQGELEAAWDLLDQAGDVTWLPASGALASVGGPVALSGELMVSDDAPPPQAIVDLARKARTDGAAAAWDQAQALPPHISGADWIRARLLAEQGKLPAAARELVEAWRVSGDWQLGLEAASLLAEASSAGALQDPADNSLAYGLAAELRDQIDHPTLSRLALLSGRASRWDPVRGAQSSAGRARVISTRNVAPPLPQSEVRAALVVAPWPGAQAQIATAKEPVGVTVDGGRPVSLDVFCQPLRVAAGGLDPSCVVDVLVDGSSVGRHQIGSELNATLSTGALTPGRHTVELALDDPSRVSAASVRFRTDGPGDIKLDQGGSVLLPRRETTAFLASSAQPFTMAALGPASLYLDLRVAGAEGGVLEVSASGPQGALPTRTVSVPRGLEPGLSIDGGPSKTASPAAAVYLSLPDAGPWTITVRPKSGTAIVRGALRVGMPAPLVERGAPSWADIPPESEPLDWPVPAPGLEVVAAEQPPGRWPLGTFSVGTTVGRQDLDEQGGDATGTVNQLEITAAWRDELVDEWLWAHVEPTIRTAPGVPQVSGGSADLFLRVVPIKLRLHLSGEYFAQDVLGQKESGRTLGARAFRPFGAGPVSVIPSLEFRERSLSLDAAPVTTEPVDPDVFNLYAASHPHALTPSLMVWAMPFQDQVAYASLGTTLNLGGGGLDQVGLSPVSRTVIHPYRVPPLQLELKYRPSYRFAGADRPSSYLRNSLGGSLGAYVKVGNPLLLWVGAGDLVYLTPGAPAENIFRVGLRVDFNGGRGLDDYNPVELDFNDLLSGRDWGDWEERGP